MNFPFALPAFMQPKQAPKRAHLDRVHLLIHPGDGTDARSPDTDKMLLHAMADRAISMKTSHEIAVVLLQMSDEEFQTTMSDPVHPGRNHNLLTEISRMSDELHDNLIVMPEVSSVFNDYLHTIWNNVRQRIEALHFTIDQHTDVLAYGEMVTRCVPVGASRFRQHFGLKNSPTIDVNCTDALIHEPHMWHKNGLRLSLSNCLSEGGLRYIPLGEDESTSA